jgi:hypothetical protein
VGRLLRTAVILLEPPIDEILQLIDQPVQAPCDLDYLILRIGLFGTAGRLCGPQQLMEVPRTRRQIFVQLLVDFRAVLVLYRVDHRLAVGKDAQELCQLEEGAFALDVATHEKSPDDCIGRLVGGNAVGALPPVGPDGSPFTRYVPGQPGLLAL